LQKLVAICATSKIIGIKPYCHPSHCITRDWTSRAYILEKSSDQISGICWINPDKLLTITLLTCQDPSLFYKSTKFKQDMKAHTGNRRPKCMILEQWAITHWLFVLSLTDSGYCTYVFDCKSSLSVSVIEPGNAIPGVGSLKVCPNASAILLSMLAGSPLTLPRPALRRGLERPE
jgi:hypothetical protein